MYGEFLVIQRLDVTKRIVAYVPMVKSALLLRIEFFEAFFKVHYTKGFRLTYPMPLPTSVAGIFGALLGLERFSIFKKMENYLFGSKILSHKGIVTEQSTYIQIAPFAETRRGVERATLIIEPSYLIAMAGPEKEIKEYEKEIRDGYYFLPYGGQNDFFLKDLLVIGVKRVRMSNLVENYSPKDFVKRVEFKKGTVLETLPVAHSFEGLSNIFYFVENGQLVLKDGIKMPSVEGIGLYDLSKFRWVIG